MSALVENSSGKIEGRSLGSMLRFGRGAEAFTASLMMHLLLGAALVYLAAPSLRPTILTPIIQLVNLPLPPKAAPRPAKAIPKPVVRPAPVVHTVVAPDVHSIPAPPIVQVPAVQPKPQEKLAEPPAKDSPPTAVETPTPVQKKPDTFIAPSSDAEYLHNPEPDYPLIARRRGWQGLTLLEVTVSVEGRPLSVRIKKSSGHDALDNAALATVKGFYRFAPASRNGEKVEATVDVPIRFSLR